MVCSNNKDRFVKYSCIFGSLNNLSDISVQFFQFGIILRCVVTCTMTYMIGIIKSNQCEGRLLFFQIANCHFAQSSGILVIIRCLFVIAQCKCIYQIFNAVPFVQATNLCFRSSIPQYLKNGRENTVLVQFA